MKSITAHILCLTCLLFALGCEAEKPFAAYHCKPLPQPQGSIKPISIALNSPAMNHALEQSPTTSDSSAWYETRNDYARATYAGQRTAIIEHSYTRVHDRQYNSSNRVHNHYSEHTWQYRSVGTAQ